MIRRRFFLVEMINNTDRRDDEVWQVRSTSGRAAAVVAASHASQNFRTGRTVPARGGLPSQRKLAREFRTYCTRRIP